MKSNLAAIILILACLGLGIVLWAQHQKNADQTDHLDQTISSFSNNVTSLSTKLDQQIRERKSLESSAAAAERKATGDLDAANAKLAATAASLVELRQEASSYSNDAADFRAKFTAEVLARSRLETNLAAVRRKAASDLETANAAISATSASLKQAQDEARAGADAIARANADIAEKSKRIDELEAQNKDLDKQSSDLRSSVANLEARMQAAQKKIDANDGDKSLLMTELKRVQAQKEELENKLSDLAFLKEHVRTLRDNLATDRRADWIRRGLYEAISQKGDERLIKPVLPGAPPGSPPTNTSLNVELHQNGGVRVNSPAATNALPARLAPDAGL